MGPAFEPNLFQLAGKIWNGIPLDLAHSMALESTPLAPPAMMVFMGVLGVDLLICGR